METTQDRKRADFRDPVLPRGAKWALSVLGTVTIAFAIVALIGRPKFPFMSLSTFIPDILVALVTGAVLSVSVFYLERQAAHRSDERLQREAADRAREEALNRWDRVRPKISVALGTQMFWPGYSAGQTPSQMGELVAAFRDVVQDYPLARWSRVTDDQKDIKAAADVDQALWEYLSIAETVEAKFSASQGWSASARHRLSEALEFGQERMDLLRSPKRYEEEGFDVLAADVYSDPICDELFARWSSLIARWAEAQKVYGIPLIS